MKRGRKPIQDEFSSIPSTFKRWRLRHPEKQDLHLEGQRRRQHKYEGRIQIKKIIARAAHGVRLAARKNEAIGLLKRGKSPVDVAMWLQLPMSVIAQWQKEIVPPTSENVQQV